ncbi:unnamed protein product [Oikopleura dioica]|uniref:Protein jagunal homolog 1 n=1 Tax=Oikopleura dioica TaxID=34765 RepID=E4XRM6_OIKDI|nr:unnamed protein product [Oikopleura dioica]CBY34718.1 unnamed protein product [Oikopleura dioica]
MSSKGKQAVTNDGSDSKYREKVADHYKESKTAKASLKWYLLFTFMANAFVAAHYFMKKYKKMYMITTKATPDPFLWELATIGTFIPSVIGWSACAKNNVKRMNMYIWGILIFGLPPLIWGAWEHHEELLKYMNSQGYRRTIAGYPRAIVIYGFILCFGEMISTGFTRGRKCIKLWTKKGSKTDADKKEEKKDK